jgi:hypothetical protein
MSFALENGNFYANAAFLYVNSERRDRNQTSLRSEDEMWYGAQFGYATKTIELGIGYHLLSPSLATDPGSTPPNASLNFNGVAKNTLGHDFEILNVYGQYNFMLGSVKSAFYADYAKNGGTNAAFANNDQDSAFAVGFKFKSGNWKAGIEYKEVEENAVYDEWADSDFGGGGADYEGLKFGAGYKFAKNSEVALTYFSNDDTILPGANANDYKRLQADLKFKF